MRGLFIFESYRFIGQERLFKMKKVVRCSVTNISLRKLVLGYSGNIAFKAGFYHSSLKIPGIVLPIHRSLYFGASPY